MKQKPFFFEAKNDETVDIHIYGVIGYNESYWNEGTNNTDYALVSLIKRLDKKYARINVHINSPGGSIADGLAIYNTLKNANAEIHTYNNGLVASMASILMLAGISHHPKTSINHLHSASTVTIGNKKEHKAAIDQLKTFETALQNAISEKTGMTVKEIKSKWFDGNEHFMSAEEANEYGLVDFIEDENITPPEPKNKLEKMEFIQVLNLYKTAIEEKTEESFWNKLTSKFNFQNKDNQNNNTKSKKMANTLTFKAKLTVLLALVGISEFVLNANNKVELNIDDAFKINDSLTDKDAEIEALKQQNLAHEKTIDTQNTQISDLQAKIDGKAAGNAANPKGNDNSTADDDDKPVVFIDDEMSAKLHAFNKQEGLY